MTAGSLVKFGPGDVSIRRLKLVIGKTSNSDDDAYFLGGRTTVRHCLIESPVNTAMFVINEEKATEGTHLLLQVCVINGLESCQRLIAFDVSLLMARASSSVFTRNSSRPHYLLILMINE